MLGHITVCWFFLVFAEEHQDECENFSAADL